MTEAVAQSPNDTDRLPWCMLCTKIVDPGEVTGVNDFQALSDRQLLALSRHFDTTLRARAISLGRDSYSGIANIGVPTEIAPYRRGVRVADKQPVWRVLCIDCFNLLLALSDG